MAAAAAAMSALVTGPSEGTGAAGAAGGAAELVTGADDVGGLVVGARAGSELFGGATDADAVDVAAAVGDPSVDSGGPCSGVAEQAAITRQPATSTPIEYREPRVWWRRRMITDVTDMPPSTGRRDRSH
jgi:hypothetical protein